MKKYFLFLIFLITTIATCAQITNDSTRYTWYKTQYGIRIQRLWPDSFSHIPYGDTAIFRPGPSRSYLMMHTDKKIYSWDGSKWSGIGGGSPGGSTGQVQTNVGGAFVGDPGLTYDTLANQLSTDSLYLFKKLRFKGYSTLHGVDAAMQFGNRNDPFFTDSASGVTLGTLAKIYPYKACDTCRFQQPFYIKVGTSDETPPTPTDIAFQWGFGDGTLSRALGYLQLEQYFGDQSEFYFEYKPENSNRRIRPFAYNLKLQDTLGFVQAIHMEDNSVWQGGAHYPKQYGSLSPNGIVWAPFVSPSVGSVVNLSILDSATGAIQYGGLNMATTKTGGFYTSSYAFGGEQINLNTPAGLFFTSTGTGLNGSFGRNYIFNVSSSNGGKIMWVGKDWGGAYSQAYEVLNNQNTIFGPVNSTDNGYKLQVVGSSALSIRNEDALTTSVIYPVIFSHILTSGGGAAGIGAGFKFRADNGINTQKDIGAVEAVYDTTTNANESSDLVIRTIRNGTANTEGLRVVSTGALKINNAFTLPNSDGSANQVLQTNGSGVVSWQSQQKILRGLLSSFTFPSISGGTSTSTTVTVTGAVAGDLVLIQDAAGGALSDGEFFDARVSANDTVTIRRSYTVAGTIASSTKTYNVMVLKN